MVKKVLKIFLYIIGGIIFILLVLTFVLWMNSPGIAEPITDSTGKTVESSISSIEKITLGGQEQYLFIRGVNQTKPVMLFLHGGPGSPELPFMKHYNTDIENDFVMVYWDQRGAGKSYSDKIPAESMTLSQLIADTKELSEYLAERFKQDKIYVMGHSWGSLLGILTAHHYPELFHAYIGVGQVAHQYQGEKISFEWVIEQALHENDEDAIKALSEMRFPDSLANSTEWIIFVLNERKYVTQFGGAMRGTTGMWPMLKLLLGAKEYTISDKIGYVKGNAFSLQNLWPEVIQTNLFEKIDSMQVPVYIFQGLHDYQTPYSIAKDFYNQVKAPQKGFFTFENSAHSPLMEEADKFNSLLRETLKQDSNINPRR